jgi:hypothetical protein
MSGILPPHLLYASGHMLKYASCPFCIAYMKYMPRQCMERYTGVEIMVH